MPFDPYVPEIDVDVVRQMKATLRDPEAVCKMVYVTNNQVCPYTALKAHGGSGRLLAVLNSLTGGNLISWWDRRETTHADLMRLLDGFLGRDQGTQSPALS